MCAEGHGFRKGRTGGTASERMKDVIDFEKWTFSPFSHAKQRRILNWTTHIAEDVSVKRTKKEWDKVTIAWTWYRILSDTSTSHTHTKRKVKMQNYSINYATVNAMINDSFQQSSSSSSSLSLPRDLPISSLLWYHTFRVLRCFPFFASDHNLLVCCNRVLCYYCRFICRKRVRKLIKKKTKFRNEGARENETKTGKKLWLNYLSTQMHSYIESVSA